MPSNEKVHSDPGFTDRVSLVKPCMQRPWRTSSLITPGASYLALGSDPRERLTHYRALIKEQLDTKTIEELRLYTQQQRAWGSQRFQQQIEVLTQRRAKATPRGRPKKSGATDEK